MVSLVVSLVDTQPLRPQGNPVASRVYSPVVCLQETRVEIQVASRLESQVESHLQHLVVSPVASQLDNQPEHPLDNQVASRV